MGKPESEYHMFDWWKKVVIHNYVNFSGRARRSEYWYYILVNVIFAIIGMVLFLLLMAAYGENSFVIFVPVVLMGLGVLALFLPGLAVAVRRLHDTGKTGWLWLIGVIPFVSSIGGIILFVFYCLEGDNGPNKYGPDPKGNPANEIEQIGNE